MSETFQGFPAISRATAVPNLFFTAVLPKMRSPAALLAFLWVARFSQERRGAPVLVSYRDLAENELVSATFTHLAGGREALDGGLRECVELGALLLVPSSSPDNSERSYALNNPQNRRALGRMGAAIAVADGLATRDRPDVFRLYEEHIGTITPIVGERLLEACERYPLAWIEDAFREAALRNVRNWKYIERILERWAEEGRPNETTARDSFEARRRRYLGGAYRHP